MKKQLTLTAIALLATITFAIANDVTPSFNGGEELTNSALNYIKMKDGSVRTYHSLELIQGAFVSPHLLANGVEKIFAGDIMEYLSLIHI